MAITPNKSGYGFSLEQAEIGDKLMTFIAGHSRGPTIYTQITVTRVTKSQVSTSDGNIWMKKTCRRVGASEWSNLSLSMYDQGEIDESEAETKRLTLASKLEDNRWREMPLEKLEQIAALCDVKVDQ